MATGETQNINVSVGNGLSETQFTKIMEAIRKMSENLGNEISGLREELQSLQDAVDAVSGRLNGLGQSLANATQAVAAANNAIADLTAGDVVKDQTITNLQDQLAAAESAITGASGEVDAMTQELGEALGAEEPPTT